MPTALRNGLIALMICTILVLICYFWVDKPVAFWAFHHNLRAIKWLEWLTHIPEIFIVLSVVIFPVLVVRYCYGKSTVLDKVLFTASISLAIAYYIRGPLKMLFGRYWPWWGTYNNLSLLHGGAYGFTWFKPSTTYASFPSGHATATVAVLGILWLFFPRWRWLMIIIFLAVAIAMIGMYYHFVSDVIAGAFLGGLTAYYTAKIMKIDENIIK